MLANAGFFFLGFLTAAVQTGLARRFVYLHAPECVALAFVRLETMASAVCCPRGSETKKSDEVNDDDDFWAGTGPCCAAAAGGSAEAQSNDTDTDSDDSPRDLCDVKLPVPVVFRKATTIESVADDDPIYVTEYDYPDDVSVGLTQFDTVKPAMILASEPVTLCDAHYRGTYWRSERDDDNDKDDLWTNADMCDAIRAFCDQNSAIDRGVYHVSSLSPPQNDCETDEPEDCKQFVVKLIPVAEPTEA